MKDSLFKNELRNIKRNSKLKKVKGNEKEVEKLNSHPFYGKQRTFLGADFSRNKLKNKEPNFPFNNFQGKSMNRLNRASIEQLGNGKTVNSLKFQNDISRGGRRGRFRQPPLPPQQKYN